MLDELYSPSMTAAARRWITPFREAFPDVTMTVVDLVRSQAGGRSGGADLDGVFGQAPVEQPVGQANGTPAVGGE